MGRLVKKVKPLLRGYQVARFETRPEAQLDIITKSLAMQRAHTGTSRATTKSSRSVHTLRMAES